MKGKLILEDGSVFHGELLNNIKATGEVVFNTGMVGYQESLTDPSYCRQILTLTYPMVGNYGIADIFMQSRKSFVNGFIIGELCEHGSNWHYETSLADFLTKQGVPCLYNVDTRAVTRKIRNAGTMKGIIVPEDAAQTEIDELFAVPIKKDVVMEVTTPEAYTLESEKEDAPFVVAMDFGVKQNIIKSMHDLGFKITVVPAHTTAEEVLAMNPDGVFLSNGPGDPADVPEIVEEVKKLIGKKPIFGICLGHQAIGEVFGGKVVRAGEIVHGKVSRIRHNGRGLYEGLPQDVEVGRYHSLIIDRATLPDCLEVTSELADGTIMGVRHKEKDIEGIQFHPESILTPSGRTMMQNFLNHLKGYEQ